MKKRVIFDEIPDDVLSPKDIPTRRGIVVLRTVNSVYIAHQNYDTEQWEFSSLVDKMTRFNANAQTLEDLVRDANESCHPTKDMFYFSDIREFAQWLVEVTE